MTTVPSINQQQQARFYCSSDSSLWTRYQTFAALVSKLRWQVFL